MKITESLLINNSLPGSHSKTADFSSWLIESEHFEKQRSGDEYYWEHQEQLQQSELDFQQPPSRDQQERNPLLYPKAESAFCSATPIDTKNEIKSASQIVPTAFYSSSLKDVAFEAERRMDDKLSLQEQNTLVPKVENLLPKIESSNDIPKLNHLKTALNFIVFKNNHLFIEEEQAELSLNMQHISKPEQKKILQFIQKHLKKQGITLNRLTINGVTHD